MEDRTRPAERSRILTVNGGSSSLKFALFDRERPTSRTATGRIERIGSAGARLVAVGEDGERRDEPVEARDQGAAAEVLIDWLSRGVGLAAVAAVGHRVVHGGGRYSRPEPVTDAMLAELHWLGPYDPEHLPGEVALIEAFGRLDPAPPQIACFDTAFHHDLPRVARIIPIPRRFEALGVRRYGFHGLSYTYLMEELERLDGPDAARGRVLLAHLGAGASLAGVRGGRPIETTMGFTPTSGLVMATRSGDLDPGLVRFLSRTEGLSVDEFHAMVNGQSGLLGVSETSSDLRDLLARQAEDVRAAEAVELFCHRVKTGLGAMAAAVGGIDFLIFAGGIGENSPEARRRICDGLEFLGVTLDDDRNAVGDGRISTDSSDVTVRVVRTDEEVVIARAAARLLDDRAA